MISFSESLQTAAGLFRFRGAPAPALDAPAIDDSERRTLSPDAVAPDDPFFLAVAEALQEAGYLDS